MSPELERLVKLQQLETAIADAARQIAAHPERLSAAEARLSEAQQGVDAARHALKDSQDSRRALEKDAAVFQGRLSKFRDQLSAVKTNREYQAMQKEMEVAQGELRLAEDHVLDRMMEAEALAASVTAAEAAQVAQKKVIETEKRELARALAVTEQVLKDASAARGALMRELEPQTVVLFEQIARMRKGVAVCATHDGLCSECHVRLRPQVYQQVRRNDGIVQCDICQRILYFVPPPAPVEPPATPAS